MIALTALSVLILLMAACVVPKPKPVTVPTVTPITLPASTPAQAPTLPAPQERISVPALALPSGSPSPDFQLTLLDGSTLRLADLRGKVVVLNFWASWCPPCRWEMPAFERVWQEYKDQGVTFVGIAVSDREKDAKAFAEKVGVTYPLGVDSNGQIARDYHVVSLPTTYFIDRKGNVASKLKSAANEGALRIFLKGQLGGE